MIGLGQAEAAAGWWRIEVLVPLAIGAAFLVALVYRESEVPEPIIPLRLFANRIFAVASLISLSMSMVMIAMIILVPLDFELGTGMAPNEAGVRLIPMTGGTALGSFVVGRLVSRTGHYRIFPILGAGVMTILCGAIAAVGLGRSWPLDAFLTALLPIPEDHPLKILAFVSPKSQKSPISAAS